MAKLYNQVVCPRCAGSSSQ